MLVFNLSELQLYMYIAIEILINHVIHITDFFRVEGSEDAYELPRSAR